MKNSVLKKKTGLRRFLTGLISFLIYGISLSAGVFALIWSAMSYNGNLDLARTMASYAADGKPLASSEYMSPNTSAVIYSSKGNPYLIIGPSNKNDNLDLSKYTDRYKAEVLSGNEIYRPFCVWGGSSLFSIHLVSGAPVIRNSSVSGAVMIVNLIPEVTGVVSGFLVYYTIFFWITAGSLFLAFHVKHKADETQRNYIANVTHSLKTPIASVKAVTETLSEVPDLDDDKRMAYYGTILGEMAGLNHLVCQILELSHLQSEKVRYEKEEISFEELFDPYLEKAELLCDCTQVQFQRTPDTNHLPLLYTDPKAAGDVIEILLDNANKYTHPGDTIRLSAKVSRKYITFCIWDNGGMIPQEDIPFIFDRFYKGKNSTFSSNGLGLAIAREIMQNLDEKLWCKCAKPNETMFYFTIRTAQKRN